jgi:hypothetical protein
MINSRRMGFLVHVSRMGERRNAYRVWMKARKKETSRKT